MIKNGNRFSSTQYYFIFNIFNLFIKNRFQVIFVIKLSITSVPNLVHDWLEDVTLVWFIRFTVVTSLIAVSCTRISYRTVEKFLLYHTKVYSYDLMTFKTNSYIYLEFYHFCIDLMMSFNWFNIWKFIHRHPNNCL